MDIDMDDVEILSKSPVIVISTSVDSGATHASSSMRATDMIPSSSTPASMDESLPDCIPQTAPQDLPGQALLRLINAPDRVAHPPAVLGSNQAKHSGPASPTLRPDLDARTPPHGDSDMFEDAVAQLPTPSASPGPSTGRSVPGIMELEPGSDKAPPSDEPLLQDSTEVAAVQAAGLLPPQTGSKSLRILKAAARQVITPPGPKPTPFNMWGFRNPPPQRAGDASPHQI